MPSEQRIAATGNVERLPSQKSSNVTDELEKIRSMLKEACPDNAVITFHFDGKLYAHIDVHNWDDLLAIEKALPAIGAGIFHSISRGDTPHHPFFHRLSAIVER